MPSAHRARRRRRLPGRPGGPWTKTDDNLLKITDLRSSGIQTFRHQRHQLLNVGHLIRDSRRRKHLITAGKADIDHRRSVQGQHQPSLSHDQPYHDQPYHDQPCHDRPLHDQHRAAH